MSEIKLLPCPFCGGEAEFVRDTERKDIFQSSDYVYVRCKERHAQLNVTIVMDSVTCGKKGKKPLRTVKIQGRPTMVIDKKKKALERNIARKEELELKLLDLTNQAEEYIDSIEKSELRIMFRLYYIDDLTWIQVAHQMNQIFFKKKIKYTEDSCRMKNKRFFEKI